MSTTAMGLMRRGMLRRCLREYGLRFAHTSMRSSASTPPSCGPCNYHALTPRDARMVASFSTSTDEVKWRSVAQSVRSDIMALQHFHEQLVSETTLSKRFVALLERLERCHHERRRVFVTGIGKSGIVAQRLASTLSSISVRSQWVHGSEWVHGELGNLQTGDVIIMLSHSGNTAELLALPEIFEQLKCDTIAIVSQEGSALATDCSLALVVPASDVPACPVPARSIVVQEAISNAIIEYLVENLGDTHQNFQANHPGGAIGDRFSKSS